MSSKRLLRVAKSLPKRASGSRPLWDVFISHASEDKEEIARPLAIELRRRGLRVWLDIFELHVGDSLRESIDTGIALSRFGIVILSRSFFQKKWTRAELNGLVQMERGQGKSILPVWYNINPQYVRRYSPLLADRLACDWSRGIDAVANSILSVVRPIEDETIESESEYRLGRTIEAWRDERFVTVGRALGFLEDREGAPHFSDRFIQALAAESTRAISSLDPSLAPEQPITRLGLEGLDNAWESSLKDGTGVNAEEIWLNLRVLGASRALLRPVQNFDFEGFDYFISHLMPPLTDYLLKVSTRANLVAISQSGIIQPDEVLIEDVIGLSIVMGTLPEVKRLMLQLLARLVQARLLIRTPDLAHLDFLLTLFFYLIMHTGHYIRALEIALE